MRPFERSDRDLFKYTTFPIHTLLVPEILTLKQVFPPPLSRLPFCKATHKPRYIFRTSEVHRTKMPPFERSDRDLFKYALGIVKGCKISVF